MALQRDTKYPGRFTTATTAHPQGLFKNRTTSTSQDGSYLEKDWLNDWDGFFGSLLSKAGMTPDGNVDAVGASQYFTALQDVVMRGDYVTAGGTANAITITHGTPITSYKDGQVFRFKASATNTGATTIKVDALGVITLYGNAHQALQGNEIVANGYCIAVYSSTLSRMILLRCTGAPEQIANGLQSQHAVTLGQLNAAVLSPNGYQKLPNGLIIQWFTGGAIAIAGTLAVTFPIAFPNSCFAVISTANGFQQGIIEVVSKTTKSVTLGEGGNMSGHVISSTFNFAIGN